MNNPWLNNLAHDGFLLLFIVCLTYLLISRVLQLCIAALAAWQRAGQWRREQHHDLQMTLHSRHTLPISLLVPEQGELPWSSGSDENFARINRTVESILRQHFPEYEVLLLVQDSNLLDRLRLRYQLQPYRYFFCRLLNSRPMKAFYRSETYPQLMLAYMPNTGLTEMAPIINLGLNLIRYRYVACIDPGVELGREALLKWVQPALNAPQRVVAVTTQVGWATKPSDWQTTLRLPLQLVQELRAGFAHRLGWRSAHWAHVAVLWRKDLLIEMGGYPKGGWFEFNLRLNERAANNKHSYQIAHIAQPIAMRGDIPGKKQYRRWLAEQSARSRQTLRRYRKLVGWRYGSLGMLSLPYLNLESLGNLWVEAAIYGVLPLGLIYGWLNLSSWALLLLLLSGPTVLISLLALWWWDREQPALSTSQLGRLIFATLLEPVGAAQLALIERWRRLT